MEVKKDTLHLSFLSFYHVKYFNTFKVCLLTLVKKRIVFITFLKDCPLIWTYQKVEYEQIKYNDKGIYILSLIHI